MRNQHQSKNGFY